MPEFIMTGKDNPDFQAFDDFTKAYIEAIFWTEEESLSEQSENLESGCTVLTKTENGIESHWESGNTGPELLAPEAIERIKKDCADFQRIYGGAIKYAIENFSQYSIEQAGHDFWLTRNGHGSGFWDRGLESTGKQLTSACGFQTSFPELSVYIGDNQKIYIE